MIEEKPQEYLTLKHDCPVGWYNVIYVLQNKSMSHVLKITRRINQGNVTYESNNYFINFIIIFNNVEELHHHHYHLPSWRDADFIHFVIVIKDVEKNLYFQDIIIFNAIMLCWIKMNLFWMLECAVMYPPPYPPTPCNKMRVSCMW